VDDGRSRVTTESRDGAGWPELSRGPAPVRSVGLFAPGAYDPADPGRIAPASCDALLDELVAHGPPGAAVARIAIGTRATARLCP